MKMVVMTRLSICILFLMTPLFAQQFVTRAPSVAASSPVLEASVGYSYFSLDTPSHQRVGLTGMEATGIADFSARWGISLNSSYVRLGNVLGTSHSGNVLSFLTGPVFYPFVFGTSRIFVHSLAGISRVDSAVPVQGTYYLGGAVSRFSYAAGLGLERPLANQFSLRVGGDYLRTTFANSSAAMRFQHNLRFTTSIVYRFGSRR